jgi:restriction system protein
MPVITILYWEERGMAKVSTARADELLRGTFQVLMDEPDGLQAKTVLQRLEKVVPPTDFENSCYPNNPGVRRWDKIVRFNTIGSVKAGWLIKDKGQWTLTDEGRKAFEKHTEPGSLLRESRRLCYQWK